jgi:hypothetical protein
MGIEVEGSSKENKQKESMEKEVEREKGEDEMVLREVGLHGMLFQLDQQT